jgi:outer membrane receptor protein involved in Fe transport
LPIGSESLASSAALTLSCSPSTTCGSAALPKGRIGVLDGSIDLTLQDGLKVSVFGRNITDRVYLRQLTPSANTIATNFGTPATYGISLSYNFK